LPFAFFPGFGGANVLASAASGDVHPSASLAACVAGAIRSGAGVMFLADASAATTGFPGAEVGAGGAAPACGPAGAAAGGARQIVYLGGLGEGASPHLRSRAETARILNAGPVPVTTLRAAMIVGAGSAAFETILALVERLPVMICPRWVSVATQPVAVADVLGVLVGVCGMSAAFDQVFDLGGPEVMTYRTMMERVARIRGKQPLLIEVPFLTPRLSSLWLHLVTPASVAVARPLVEGLRVPTVAEDDRIWELVGLKRTSFDDAIRSALGARERP